MTRRWQSGMTPSRRGGRARVLSVGASVPPEVALRLRMNSPQGSSAFVDESSYQHVVSAFGVTADESWKKSGNASALIATSGGNQNRLTIPDHPMFKFGTGQFTLKKWVRVATLQTALILFKAQATGFYPFVVMVNGSSQIQARGFHSDGNFLWDVTGPTLSIDTDYWIQVRRRNADGQSYFELGVNGTQVAQHTTAAWYDLYDNTGPVVIGNYNSGAQYPLRGRVDDVEIVKGVAEPFALPS